MIGRRFLKIVKSIEQEEGVGARVKRSIGRPELRRLDPFLLLDEFKVAAPAGFSDHPHRGIETITYILPTSPGTMEHEDFTGKREILKQGDVQWMTAGKGIVHAEVPSADGETCHGLQLWLGLNSKNRMIDPSYQDLTGDDIVEIQNDRQVLARIIAGEAFGKHAKSFTRTPITYVHFVMPPKTSFEHSVPAHHNCFIYTLEGVIHERGQSQKIESGHTVVLSRREEDTKKESNEASIISIENSEEKFASLVIISGEPLNETLVQHGPFVMGSEEELKNTFIDFYQCKNGFENASDWHSHIQDRVMH